MHTAYWPELDTNSNRLQLTGQERDHAIRTKRLRTGEELLLFDGKGTIARCRITSTARTLDLDILSCQSIPKIEPRVEVCCPAPKSQRASTLIDLLSQVGADSWRPLETAFTEQPITTGKIERLQRVAQESLKQCQRAWMIEFRESVEFMEALTGADCVIVADASGVAWETMELPASGAIRVLVGPEGGWREDELETARSAGVAVVRFGQHVMRLETAAGVSCAMVLARAQQKNG